MDKKTTGSWLIHHTNKLQAVTNQAGFENTFVAGKAGILLSAISADRQLIVNNDRLNVLATASNINTTFELPLLVDVLVGQNLVQRGATGVEVLGVTSARTLQHTADIFTSRNPSPTELAAISLAESASAEPIFATQISERLADEFSLSKPALKNLLSEAEQIGLVDAEELDSSQKLYFNGNLFRRDTTRKIKSIFNSLGSAEQSRLNELTELLRTSACVSVEKAAELLGDPLFKKVTAVGLFDITVVSNSTENAGYLTLPSAFSKFGSNSMVDDAFDLAKAFISSVTYGMTKSSWARGKISMVDALLSALIRGESVGPVSAIGEDYKVLELKGVVEVKIGTKNGRTGPMLSLLKQEVGQLALQAIRKGDVSEHSLPSLPTAAVTSFSGPEANREKARRKQTKTSPKATNDMLSVLRTGKL